MSQDTTENSPWRNVKFVLFTCYSHEQFSIFYHVCCRRFDLALVLCVLRTKVVLQPTNKPPFFYWSFNPNSCFYICDGSKKMQLQSGLRVGNMLDVASSDTQRNAAAGPLSCWCPSEVRGAAADPRRLLSNHKAKEKQPVTLQHVRHVYTPPRVSSW